MTFLITFATPNGPYNGPNFTNDDLWTLVVRIFISFQQDKNLALNFGRFQISPVN